MYASILVLVNFVVFVVGLSSCSSEVSENRHSSHAKLATNSNADDQLAKDPREAISGGAEADSDLNKNKDADTANQPKDKTDPTEPIGVAISCDQEKHTRLVPVATSADLAAALEAAKPGDLIRIKDGTYTGPFLANMSANADEPITLCGSVKAILANASIKNGRVLSFIGVSHWQVLGITVRNGQKGIMTEESSFLLFDGITVHNIGHEAVHFKTNSHHNTIQNSWIYDTGLDKPEWGEGLYFGTAKSNGAGDRSDFNNALNNKFGPGIAAEHIDAKEYSSAGLIEGNTFDGTGMKGKNSSESIIYIKGNDYIVRANYLKNPFLKGIRVWDVVKDESGYRNLFEENTIENAPGLGISIEGGEGNIVKCDNILVKIAKLTNVTCVP